MWCWQQGGEAAVPLLCLEYLRVFEEPIAFLPVLPLVMPELELLGELDLATSTLHTQEHAMLIPVRKGKSN